MKINMARWDRVARFIIAVLLLILGLTVIESGLRWVFYIVGAVFIATSLFGYCPLYALLGTGTRRDR